MSAPDPVLLEVASGGGADRIPDENGFVTSTLEHRMAGEVLAAVDEGRLRLSAVTAMSLAAAVLAERHRHDTYWQAIWEVQDRLAAIDVEVAVIKGVATEARWYAAPGQRVCTDVDLLLAPSALAAADGVISALAAEPLGGPIQSLVERRVLQHVDLRLGDIQLDLHFDPFKTGLQTRQTQEVWDSTTEVAIGGRAVRVLSPEVELILLLLHLNKDGFAYLGSLLDIRQLVTRADLDWRRLRALVAAEGFDVPVWKSLALVNEVLDLGLHPIPARGWRAATWDLIWGRRVLGGHEARRQAPTRQRLLAIHYRGRNSEVMRELRRQLIPHRHLAEVAGRINSEESYLGYMVDRLRRRA